MAMIWKDGQAVEATAEDQLPAPITPADLDALATRVTDSMFEQDTKLKALGLVLADIIQQAFGVTQSVARQQVKDRFRNYYRNLLS